jgi:hypothetical protein
MRRSDNNTSFVIARANAIDAHAQVRHCCSLARLLTLIIARATVSFSCIRVSTSSRTGACTTDGRTTDDVVCRLVV